MEEDAKLQLKATLELDYHLDHYHIIDFLNKNLKDKRLMFGLAKKEDKMVISIYET